MTQVSLQYRVPTLSYLGSLAELTLGSGGSTLDGTCLNAQKGKGNDTSGPHPSCVYTPPPKHGNH